MARDGRERASGAASPAAATSIASTATAARTRTASWSLYAFPRGDDGRREGTRLGVSVGRKVGGAADRNTVKRALREAFWALDAQLPGDYDFVLVARPDSAGLVEREGTDGVARRSRE